jgi:type II secretory pathway predicted ATPase ExeA
MITQHYGLIKTPFSNTKKTLLPRQEEILSILKTHCSQGGLCIVAGEPGTGKSIIKDALINYDSRNLTTACIGRTLHTYSKIINILAKSFQVPTKGSDLKCEEALIQQATKLHAQGRMQAIIIDDAHLMDIETLRKLRLLLAEFPKNHNLILFCQEDIFNKIQLTINEDLRSRITASEFLHRLCDEDICSFILDQFDQCGLPHNTISEDAIALIARASEGVLRNAIHLTISSLIQTVQDQTHCITIHHVNTALKQPHWRRFEQMVAKPLNPQNAT